jgi:hypothetical protein
MATYLESRGSEVLNVLLTEWNMDDALRVRGEEEREAGILSANRETAMRMLALGFDTGTIARCTGMSIDSIEKLPLEPALQ